MGKKTPLAPCTAANRFFWGTGPGYGARHARLYGVDEGGVGVRDWGEEKGNWCGLIDNEKRKRLCRVVILGLGAIASRES